MSWKEWLSAEPYRSRSILATFMLGVVVAMPIPVLSPLSVVALLLLLLWLCLIMFCYSLFFKPQWFWVMALVSLLVAFSHALASRYWLIFGVLVLSLLWARRRNIRLKVFLLLLFSTTGALAARPNLGLPGMEERRLDGLSSCGNLDKIPWKFRLDLRKTRMLFSEEMRLSSDESVYLWELYQVMNPDGLVTFIFRRKLPNGDFLSLAARDFKFIEVRSSPERSEATQRQNFKHLINRPALMFYRADGSEVSYMPGSVGKSTIMIQFAQSNGLYLPPVYIRGNFCDRPASLSESDTTGSSFGKVKNDGGEDDKKGSKGKK